MILLCVLYLLILIRFIYKKFLYKHAIIYALSVLVAHAIIGKFIYMGIMKDIDIFSQKYLLSAIILFFVMICFYLFIAYIVALIKKITSTKK